LAWALEYSDILGGILGIVGSLVLAYPLVAEISDRRRWAQLTEFLRLYRAGESISAEEREAQRNIRDHVLNDRLGRFQHHRMVTLLGLLLLFAGFLFMTAAGYERHNSQNLIQHRPPT